MEGNLSEATSEVTNYDETRSTREKLELKTFDEALERNLKATEEENEFINTYNELLLTPREESQSELLDFEEHAQQVEEISNEVKFEKLQGKESQGGEIFGKRSSQSSKNHEKPSQPLFETVVDDQSQSNLLNFGFKVQIKSHHKPQRENSGSSNPEKSNEKIENKKAPVINEEVPMDIESGSKSKKSQPSEHIQIRVSNCEMDNSLTKNNDIYGITEPLREQKPAEEAKEEEEIKQEDLFKKQDQPMDIQGEEKDHFKAPLTVEEIVDSMTEILKKDTDQKQKAQEAQQLIKDHVDCVFMKPLTDIGRELMEDGKTLIILIEAILLSQPNPQARLNLKRELIRAFVAYIKFNINIFIDYQQTARETRSFSRPRVIESLPVECENSVDYEIDESNYAQNDSFTNSTHKDIENREVAKRTVPSRNYVQKNAPNSGKVTRKRKNKSMAKKGITSIKKSVKMNQNNEQQSPERRMETRGRPKKGAISIKKSAKVQFQDNKETSADKQMENRGKSKSRSNEVERLEQSKGKSNSKKVNNQELGSSFTFKLRESTKDSQKCLVQVRASRRLAQKDLSRQKSPNMPSNSKRQSFRVSSTKKYEEIQLDVDFLKKHLKEIKVSSSMMERDFRALYPLDDEIIEMIKQMQENKENYDEIALSHQEEGDNVREDDEFSNLTMEDSQQASRARFQEFKRNINKYKPTDIPIVIKRVVNPDINGHGIYALLELGKISQFVFKTRYAITHITKVGPKLRRLMDQDYQTAKELVGNEEMAFLVPTMSLLELINKEKDKI